ncbi:uncharacterized protein LOC133730411 [Rosa rugosa]|uniref:uncharacterized protein LOC133730411 n=1 Tax=Rosa rugosa TaxID=74645 RepID=UPI002B415AC0|nr:uncharacterized protein LOC133730411 [Rosa rugosa]
MGISILIFFIKALYSAEAGTKSFRLNNHLGQWLTTEALIVQHLNSYFRDMYTATPTDHVQIVLDFIDLLVTNEMNASLMATISLEEVKAAVFELGALKAPDPDGFSGSFYQTYWNIIKEDNILVAQELFHHPKLLKSGTEGEFALKLDMNKAYDRVDWNFLEMVLFKLGFHHTWVRLVMNCVTSTSMTLLINGSPGRKFRPTRGLRQCDQLSPFLFLFINDVLSTMIRKIYNAGLLDAIKLNTNDPLVSHLFFADDSIFFLKATLSNCEVLSDTIHQYCCASGQSINKQKSTLFFSHNTQPEIVHLISSVLDMKSVPNLGHYLGLPTVWGRSKLSALAYVKENILQKITC